MSYRNFLQKKAPFGRRFSLPELSPVSLRIDGIATNVFITFSNIDLQVIYAANQMTRPFFEWACSLQTFPR